jgi:N-acetylglutamate synthase-like GNAT family acetyltransferase
MSYNIRTATSGDLETIQQFIAKAGANASGIDQLIESVYMYESESKDIKALICVEEIGNDGLLRSLVVDKTCQIEDVLTFFKVIMAKAKERKINDLYLITNAPSSQQFLSMFGFTGIEGEVPKHIQVTEHFQNSARNDTMVMKRSL